jgi:hypothetical protein
MTANRRILAHVVIETSANESISNEAMAAALRSAIQVGLNARVLELNVFALSPDMQPKHPGVHAPHSEGSEDDQVIEEYEHCGMLVKIFREAGLRKPPKYFAVVMNPGVKNPTGGVIEASSYGELRAAADARAERKAYLLQRKQAQQT